MDASMSEVKSILDAQQGRWQRAFGQDAEMFGKAPSEPAMKAAELFKRELKLRILELGAGQGRDTLFFAKNHLQVVALDYSEAAVEAIETKATGEGIGHLVEAVLHDIRRPLPFPDGTFDACYSHMLYGMALTVSELERLSAEVRRVLKPGGLNVFTVRHTRDPHYGAGVHRGEHMYEVGGFIVHFLSRQTIEHLAQGYDMVSIDEFEEGPLPERLFRVTLRKPAERR